MKLEWKPTKKNGGRPLGDVYIGGKWNGYMAWGEVSAYAERLETRVRVVGPLADYHRTCLREERNRARRRFRV